MPFNLLGFASDDTGGIARPGAKGCDVIELIGGVVYRTHSRIMQFLGVFYGPITDILSISQR